MMQYPLISELRHETVRISVDTFFNENPQI